MTTHARLRLALPSAALLLAALLLTGAAAGARAQDPPPAPPGDLQPVSLGSLLRAQVTAQRSTLMASGMAGRIAELAVRDGARVTEGQLLVQFDCRVQEGQLARGRAALEKKRRVQDGNERLGRLGSTSAIDRAVGAAEVAEAEAEVRMLQAMVEKCSIRAPFAGRVSDMGARQHQYVNEGAPLFELMDDRAYEVELIVPSGWLRWLKPRHPFSVRIDETGRAHPVELDRVAGRVDAVSQSVKIYGRILGPVDELLAGMSGRAEIVPPEIGPPEIGQ